jgi:4-methyl-5(b-hydroxyethyl)-thiazole monophosphate biosynthesis
MKIYVHLAEGFEEIEAISVIDVLRRANLPVETVSITGSKDVTGSHNITILADKIFEEINYAEGNMIVIPGGMPGTVNLENHAGLRGKIKDYEKHGKWLAAICAGPMIFGKMGIMQDKTATSYPGFEQYLKGAVISADPVVVSGNVITSRGAGTALLFALKIVEVFKGAEEAALLMESMQVC